MKLSIYGEFVDDTNPFVYEKQEDYSKLIVSLINEAQLMVKGMGFRTAEKTNRPIKDLNEYLNYNVDGFEDFTVDYKLVDINCGNIRIPIYTFQPKDETNPYVLFVNGQPGELHYLLKNNIGLLESVNNNQGVLSFGMKTGSSLYFIKNYINEKAFVREEYIPGQSILAEIYNIEYLINYNEKKKNNVLCSQSAFNYPSFCTNNCMFLRIRVKEIEPHEYEIYITDCDGRPEERFVVTGESLYSAYYNYMVEKGYYISREHKEKNLNIFRK